MSVGTADLHTAIVATWDASGLAAKFTDFWSAADKLRYMPIHEREAAPNMPFPYCVVEGDPPRVLGRMSRAGSTKWEFREYPIAFNVHAEQKTGDARSPKQIAAYLAEELMKVFGGHPTDAPQAVTLANGAHLITQYVSDYPTPTELDRCQWTVRYSVRVDVPVTVA